MVNKIVYTYKFNNLPNSEVLKEDCKVFLVTILNKFDPDKGHKAFTYFSVITKNWFIAETKKNKKKLKKEVDYDGLSHSIIETQLVYENTYLEDVEKQQFFNFLFEEIEWWHASSEKENDQKVLQAIKILFETSDEIEIFNKKAIYVYLREITGLNTKQITNSLTKIRKKYRGVRNEWDNGEI
jgi:DNA-directed RNA polymerase specialized sigma subunit